MTSITVTVPRALILTANGREYWRKRARKVKALRLLAAKAHADAGKPRFERARIDVLIDYPDRRRRDCDNLAPTTKALVDGMVAAGLLPDDDDTHLRGPHRDPSGAITPGEYRFHFQITQWCGPLCPFAACDDCHHKGG